MAGKPDYSNPHHWRCTACGWTKAEVMADCCPRLQDRLDKVEAMGYVKGSTVACPMDWIGPGPSPVARAPAPPKATDNKVRLTAGDWAYVALVAIGTGLVVMLLCLGSMYRG